MTKLDWTVDPEVTLSLDANIKQEGNSSFYIYIATGHGAGCKYGIGRDGKNQCKMIFWAYNGYGADVNKGELWIGHSSYGAYRNIGNNATWTKYRVSVWYDEPNDTKWLRIERWQVDHWQQIGDDYNQGTGVPAGGEFKILVESHDGYYHHHWVDVIDCYTE